jgi:Ras homolog gene family, member A
LSDRSLTNTFLSHQWTPEVIHFCPGVPILLVGLKKDLRDDPGTIRQLRKSGQRPVSPTKVSIAPARGASCNPFRNFCFGSTLKILSLQGKVVGQKIGSFMYVECSAKTCDGVYEAFKVAGRLALLERSRKRDRCTLL